MNEKIPVNDGGGLFDAEGLIDSLIVDCNTIVKKLASGEYVGFCAKTVEMVQKLAALKQGVKHDMDVLQKQVDDLLAERGEEDVQG